MRSFVAKSVLAFVSLGALMSLHAEQTSDYAVQVSATVSKSPPSITLSWPAPTVQPSGYRIYRKSETDGSFGGAIASLSGTATSWTDTGVAVGTAYEYKIDTNGSYGTGFIFAGIEVPLIEDRGKVVLLVDNTMSQPLSFELSRLQQDLTGDGWTVIRHDVGRSDSLPGIKQMVLADYNADQNNVKALFIFGHVPVPYSGDINPDGHSIHKGAWPADTYFANIDGGWSDNSVYDTSATARTDNIQANWNTPGDGKFDQSSLPGDAKLQVGRVDLWNMGLFSSSETDLLRNYLNKDHNFRVGNINAQRRGILCDNFGTMNGEAFAANGWRAFPALMGPNVTDAVPDENSFVGALKSNTYLWGYGCGPGYWFSVGNVVTTDDMKNSDPHCVFCMLFGSFFGDWDCQNNMMRSFLCTNSTGLATMWAGRPNWYVHHMALGKNIGYAAKLSQNNSGLYPTGQAARQIHVSLLGDPTLRMHPVFPPSNVQGSGNTITWSGSADGSVLGYHVYRSSSASGPFSRLTSSLVTGTSFADNTAAAGTTYTYMVRAVKLETSGGGTYFNPSEGAFGTVTIGSGGGSNGPPVITSAASATPNPATAGQNVTFSVAAQDPDNDPLSTSWDFGDGSTSSSNQHTYASAGNYTAKATLDDGHGHTITSSVSVTVNPAGGGGGGGGTFSITQPLAANPNAPTTSQTVTFSVAASNPIVSASYDYGDNSHGTGNTHVYAAPGQYNAIVNVSDAQGHTAFSTLLLTVAQGSGGGGGGGPFAITQGLAANPNQPAAGQTVTFSVGASNPIASASYDYGDNSHGTSNTHVYASPGQYNAIVNIADAQGDTAFSTLLLTVVQGGGSKTNHPPVIANALAANPNPAAVGQAVTFTVKATDADNDTLSYSYAYGDNTTGTAASHTYAKAGTYTASVTIGDGKGGSVSSSTNVIVNSASGSGGNNNAGGSGNGGGTTGGSGGGTDSGSGSGGGATPPANALKLSALNIKLNLKAQDADSVSLSGAVPVPAGFDPANSTMTLTIGSVTESFQLNASGTAVSKSGAVHVHLRRVKKTVPAQNAPFTIALRGSFSALATAGLDVAHNRQNVTLPVTIAYAGATNEADASVAVTAKAGQSVTARLAK